MLFTLAAILCFSACGKDSGEPINFAVWLERAESGFSWSVEIEKQGVVRFLDDEIMHDESTNMDGMIFEAVGEGETSVRFCYIKTGAKEAARTVTYRMRVDSQYNITGEKTGDEKAAPIEIKNKNEAEEYIFQALSDENKNAEKLTLIYDRTEKKNGEPRYFFDVYTIVEKSDGRFFMVYVKTVSVNSVGEIEEYVKDKKPKDIPMSEK